MNIKNLNADYNTTERTQCFVLGDKILTEIEALELVQVELGESCGDLALDLDVLRLRIK